MALAAAVPILSVDDLPRALDYYQRVLGFRQSWVWGEPPELACVCRDRIELQLARRGKLGPPGASQAYVHCSDVDAYCGEVTRAGAAIEVPLADRFYGMRDFSLRDESGNRLDFGAPLPREEGPPAAEDLEVFVPAKDFALSKRFYAALGFHTNWEEGDLAELELAGVRVLLQNFYHPGWAGNFMIHIRVTDADAWARHARAALAAGDFPGTKVEGPREESWGFRVAYVWDPSNVLLHFAERLPHPV